MQVLKIYPKDIYVDISLSVKDIELILLALDLSKIDYDGTKPEQVKSVEVVKNLYEILKQALEEIK